MASVDILVTRCKDCVLCSEEYEAGKFYYTCNVTARDVTNEAPSKYPPLTCPLRKADRVIKLVRLHDNVNE